MDFELGLLERAAYLAVEEQREAANQIADGVAAMTVTSANQIVDDVAAMTVTSANQITYDVAAMTVTSANQIADGVAPMTVTSANELTDDVASMTDTSANQIADDVPAMTVTSENTTSILECQKDSETKDGDIAALTTQLQINEGSGETVEQVAPCDGDAQQKIPEHSTTSGDSIPELSTITDNTSESSIADVNDEITHDTASHLGSPEVTSCEHGCGLIKEISHDAVESQSSSDSGSESSEEESDSTDTDNSTSDENATDDNLACCHDTASDKEQEMKDSQTTLINDKTSLNF